MSIERIKRNGKYVYVDTDAGDAHTNPLYSVQVRKDGTLDHSMAFDPRYGPGSQEQIDWHIARGTPRAETWEVGVPC